MTYTVNEPKPVHDAVHARLVSSTGKQIGEGEAPADVTTPYGVLYMLPDVSSDGSLEDPDSDVWWEWQVTCVGRTQNEALGMQGLVRTAMIGWTPTVAGLSLSKVEMSSGSGVQRDPELETRFFSTDRFRVFTSPT